MVISRKDVSVAAWAELLAAELAQQGRESAAASQALDRLLGG